ncbi:HET-domain-containing protein, partial [Aspergillus sclerotioniger CBS 115572]
MRLLQVSDLKLLDFLPDSIPPYAILSHTWGKDEVLFEDILHHTAINKSSYVKVEGAAKQASANNLEYVWIDNCCIDKSSSAELSEALNSMFAWYENATVCYAYLSDVPTNVNVNDPGSEFTRSRWFTRGFTLQELLAPKEVIFFSSNWEVIGKKTELYEILSTITGIGVQYLRHKAPLSSASIANRMSWVANRETSRPEDIAYCLLGIFNINMPLLYGERDRAFIRLQEEIMRQSDDQSIFAW